MRASGVLLCLLLLLFTTNGSAQTRIPLLAEDEIPGLQRAVKPMPGESPWRDIPWLIDLRKARLKAARENKPLLIFTAADGNPIGRI